MGLFEWALSHLQPHGRKCIEFVVQFRSIVENWKKIQPTKNIDKNNNNIDN